MGIACAYLYGSVRGGVQCSGDGVDGKTISLGGYDGEHQWYAGQALTTELRSHE